MTAPVAGYSVRRAALWMTGSLFAYVVVAVSAREASADLDTPRLLFFRVVLSLLVVCALLPFSKGGYRQLRTTRLPLHVWRSVALSFGMFGWFYAIATIPLAQVFVFEFTIPLWVALLAPFLVGERLTTARLGSIGLGFAGVLAIVGPAGFVISPGAAAILGGAVGFALSMIATRRLSTSDPPFAILAITMMVQTPLLAVFVLLAGSFALPPPGAWLDLAVLVASSVFAQYCQTRAFACADTVVVAPMDYMRLPLIAVIGAQFYDEPIELTLVLGAALILAGNAVNLLGDRRPRRGHGA